MSAVLSLQMLPIEGSMFDCVNSAVSCTSNMSCPSALSCVSEVSSHAI